MNERQLWVPGEGHTLDSEYPVPSTEQLCEEWQAYAGGDVQPAPGVFGAVRVPETPPSAYASIDLCEVVRQTHMSIRLVEDVSGEAPVPMVNYAQGLSFGEQPGTPLTPETNQLIRRDVTSVAQVLINAGLVHPVEHVEAIGSVLRSWRALGVYVLANTSTLPGCEPGTIRFLQEYLPDGFDGLLLPRNWDGALPLTKGLAARNVIESFTPADAPVPAVKVDDAEHHLSGFHDALAESPSVSAVATFMPTYEGNPVHDTSVLADTPFAAFMQAREYLHAQLGIDAPAAQTPRILQSLGGRATAGMA